jgi:hypothetical protein
MRLKREATREFCLVELIMEVNDFNQNCYSVRSKYGRIGGEDVMSCVAVCGQDLEWAKSIFDKIFFDRTGLEWENRKSTTDDEEYQMVDKKEIEEVKETTGLVEDKLNIEDEEDFLSFEKIVNFPEVVKAEK